MQGKVGDELSQEAGYEAARQTGLSILGSLKATLGDLDRVEARAKCWGLSNACLGSLTRRRVCIVAQLRLPREWRQSAVA